MPGGHPSVFVIEIARIIAVLFRMPRGIHLIKPAASCDLTGKLTTFRPIRLPPPAVRSKGPAVAGREFIGGANPASCDPSGKVAQNTMGEFHRAPAIRALGERTGDADQPAVKVNRRRGPEPWPQFAAQNAAQDTALAFSAISAG